MHRNPIIAANWKMNFGVGESLKFITQLTRQPLNLDNIELILCPPFVSLYTAGVALQDTGVKMGAQNCHTEDSGAYTGEVSAAFLKELGCDYVIVGHSERRQIFRETDSDVARKTAKALEHGLTPIVCVGETESERNEEKTFRVLEKQLLEGLAGLDREAAGGIILAYEPVWAIGTGKTATCEQAQEVHAYIRSWLNHKFGTGIGGSARILYGGSVKPDNIRALMSQPDIDGGLVGGASLKVDQLLEIVKQGSGVVKT